MQSIWSLFVFTYFSEYEIHVSGCCQVELTLQGMVSVKYFDFTVLIGNNDTLKRCFHVLFFSHKLNLLK